MNRQSVSKAQKPKNSALLPSADILQRKINRNDFGASTVAIRSSSEQADKTGFPNAESHFNHDFSKIPVRLNSPFPIQAKIKIGQPDDKYEQEADRVAEQVMKMPDPRLSSSLGDASLANCTIPRGGTIQRACASCSAEYKTSEDENRPVQPANLCPKCRTQEQGLIQTKKITPIMQAKTTGGVTPEETPALNSGIQSLQGGGQPLSGSERGFFEPRFGTDFSNVRLHNDTRAAGVARLVNARAFTLGHNIVFGAGEYSPEASSGKKLLAHELTHVVQQKSGPTLFSEDKYSRNSIPNSQELGTGFPESRMEQHATTTMGEKRMIVPDNKIDRRVRLTSSEVVQRDLALEPLPGVAPQANLTDEQIQEAIRFNRRRYNESSIRQIQDVVGSETTGILDANTVRMIALLQEDFGLIKDGKVGSDTFDLINRVLTAEGAGTDTCLTSFRVTGPRIPMDLRALPGGLANIFTRFDVDIRFSSRCNCSDFDYRQFICGDVTRTTGGVTTPENHVFSNLPAGQLLSCPDWREDGDTSIPVRYGHRNAAGRPENRYLDDVGNVNQVTGCTFESFDVPGIWGLTAVSGSRYDFDIRFFGDVRRRGIGRLERKFWAVRDSVNIP